MTRFDELDDSLECREGGAYVTYEDAKWWMVQAIELAKALDCEINSSRGFEGDNLTDLMKWARERGKLPSEFDQK